MKAIAKILFSLLIIIGLVAGGAYYYLFQSGDKTPLEELLPGDTLGFADIAHNRDFGIKLAASEYGKAYAEFSKGLVALLALSSTKGDMPSDIVVPEIGAKEAIGFARFFNRQIAIAALPNRTDRPDTIGFPHLVLLAHFQGKPADFEQLLSDLTESYKATWKAQKGIALEAHWTSENWEGYTLRTLNLPQGNTEDSEEAASDFAPTWTTDGKRLFAAPSSEELKASLQESKNVTLETSLAFNPNFLDLDRFPDAQDARSYINLGAIVPNLVDWVEEIAISQEENPGISIKAFARAIGFLELESATLSMSVKAGEERYVQGVRSKSKTGVFELIDLEGKSMTPPLFAPEQIYSSSSLPLDTGEAIVWFKDVILEAFPMAMLMYPSIKAEADDIMGQDIETFLIDAFSEEMHYFADYSVRMQTQEDGTEEPFSISSSVAALGLENAPQFEATIEELKDAYGIEEMGLLEEASIGAARYYTLAGFQTNGYDIAYSIHKNKLIISFGDIEVFKKALQLLDSDGPGGYQEPIVSQTLEKLPPEAAAYNLLRLSRVIAIFKTSLEAAAKTDDDIRAIYKAIDWDAIEALNLTLVSKSYQEGNFTYSINAIAN